MIDKPFCQACDNNKDPILTVLQHAFANVSRVLEIGSGTGQHAVHFAPGLPHLTWQTSDRALNLHGIEAWMAANPAINLPGPIPLDVDDTLWPNDFDAVFSANTAHIMPWKQVERMFLMVGKTLWNYGTFALYGPFNYNGKFTSEGNFKFDTQLKLQNPNQGIRDFEAINCLALSVGLVLLEDHAMPANNRLLIWEKSVAEQI
ncbi:MAG: DUF938 domain-containing protein [Agarilytica sp.]